MRNNQIKFLSKKAADFDQDSLEYCFMRIKPAVTLLLGGMTLMLLGLFATWLSRGNSGSYAANCGAFRERLAEAENTIPPERGDSDLPQVELLISEGLSSKSRVP
jgi:hypothetical protein